MTYLPHTLFLIFAIGGIAQTAASPPATQPVEKVLLDRAVGDAGQHLVVIQGPDRQPMLLNSVADPKFVPYARAFELRVELRAPGGAPLLVAAKAVGEVDYVPELRGAHVLDALVGRNAAVLGVVEDGGSLIIWQISFHGPVAWSYPVPIGVTPMAAPWPLNERATMKLARMKDGRLSYEMVLDKRFHSIYEQASPKCLEFKLIRTWDAQGKVDMNKFIRDFDNKAK